MSIALGERRAHDAGAAMARTQALDRLLRQASWKSWITSSSAASSASIRSPLAARAGDRRRHRHHTRDIALAGAKSVVCSRRSGVADPPGGENMAVHVCALRPRRHIFGAEGKRYRGPKASTT